MVTGVGLIGVLFAVVWVLDIAGSAWAGEILDHMDSEQVGATPILLAADLGFIGLVSWAAAVAGSLTHQRSVRSLVAPLHPFRWSIVHKVLAFEAAAFALFRFVPVIVGVDVTFTGFDADHLKWLVPLLALTLLQTSGEDVLFKGYLLRQLGAATGIFWLAPVMTSGLFVAVHIDNPDAGDLVWMSFVLFAASDLLIVYLIMRTGGMEAALVLHWTNNMTIFFLLGERSTQAGELTLFVWDNQPGISDDVLGGLLYSAYLGAMVVAFTWPRSPFHLKRQGWSPPVENRFPLAQGSPNNSRSA